jgi:hypothetical protein
LNFLEVLPRDNNYAINHGGSEKPSLLKEIHPLEMGPNRCITF